MRALAKMTRKIPAGRVRRGGGGAPADDREPVARLWLYPVAAETLGLNVIRIRYLAVMVSGALAGLRGAFLSTSSTGLFLDNMTAGRGYIAHAILILGRRHPFGILAAALLFGAAEALQLRAQLLPIGVPLQFLIMLPYVLTIVVLAGFAQRSGAPAAQGVPFRRKSAE